MAATEADIARHDVVVFHWQMPHVGDPANEWADREADTAAADEQPRDVVSPIYPFASALFPRDVHSERHWAGLLADKAVARRLLAFVEHTELPSKSDWQLRGVSVADRELLDRVATERCFHSDEGHKLSTFTRRIRAERMTCPYGCAATCTWHHFCFECPSRDMAILRRRWYAWTRMANYHELQVEHDELTYFMKWLNWGDPAVRASPLNDAPKITSRSVDARSSGRLSAMRRITCGFVDGAGAPLYPSTHDVACGMVAAGAELLRTACAECENEWAEDRRTANLAERVFGRFTRIMRSRVTSGGPHRRAALRRGLSDGAARDLADECGEQQTARFWSVSYTHLTLPTSDLV